MAGDATIVLSRRQVLRAAALTAGAAVAATSATVIAGPAVAAAGSAAAPGDEAQLLTTLPVRYGTPTDIARTTDSFVWTLDRDGVVQRFDRDVDAWVRAGTQDWPTVLAFGEVQLARWGRPGGPNEVVLVLGSDPEPPVTPTPPTGPTNPTQPTDPTQPADPTSTPVTTTNSVVAPAYPPVKTGGGLGSGGVASGNLSYTGFDLGRFGLIGLGLLATGGALLALRRRRAATDGPAMPPERTDPEPPAPPDR